MESHLRLFKNARTTFALKIVCESGTVVGRMRLLEFIDQCSQEFVGMQEGRLPRTSGLQRRVGGPPKGPSILGRTTIADDIEGYAIFPVKLELLQQVH